MDETNFLQHLHQASLGERFLIERVDIQGELKRRLLDLGFVPGAVIEVLKASPLGDPISYRVAGTVIALRQEESQLIWGMVISS